MPLYLAATPDRLAQARAVTPRLAHVAYRLGSGSELLAAPLPSTLRGGLMVVSDWDCPPLDDPDRLARQLARVCLRRGYAGAAADFDPPARPDRLALLEALSPLLTSCGRTLYVPEHCPVAGATILLCTALSGGTLEGRLTQAVDQYGAEHMALDLQRLAMDFPVPCPSGQGTALTRSQLAALAAGRSTFYSDALCARYFTLTGEGRTHFILFDDAQTLRRKLALARSQGIRDALVMLPEVEDILVPLFAGEA